MIKLTVFNLKEFLQVVNECIGAVNIIYPDGIKENINKQEELQRELQSRHNENKGCLPLVLSIPLIKDYLRIVYFSAGDC